MKVEARLVQRHNDKTDRKEWALIAKKSNRVLKWFGPTKPSKEAVQKEERRVQYWKHAGGALEMIDERPGFRKYEPVDQTHGWGLGTASPYTGKNMGWGLGETITSSKYPMLYKILKPS